MSTYESLQADAKETAFYEALKADGWWYCELCDNPEGDNCDVTDLHTAEANELSDRVNEVIGGYGFQGIGDLTHVESRTILANASRVYGQVMQIQAWDDNELVLCNADENLDICITKTRDNTFMVTETHYEN